MVEKPKRILPVKFPKRFLWGVATAAHQVEGGTHNQWSVWELENAKSLAKQAEYKLDELPVWDDIRSQAIDPDNYVSGRSTNHYELYETDFTAVQAMGMNAFRFSIEWSRVEPQQGEWSDEALQHYRDYLVALRRKGIEPIVTLMHWSLPTWFTERGGFEHHGNIKYFERFVSKLLDELGEHMRLIITFNEPEGYVGNGWIEGVWPPAKRNLVTAIRVYVNIMLAHRRIYKLAHSKSRRFKVGMSKNVTHFIRDDEAILSKIKVWWSQYVTDYWMLSRIRRRLDFIGVNYYFTKHVAAGKFVRGTAPLDDLGHEIEPGNIQFVLERLHGKYKKPMIVTENGVADLHDRHRRQWIAATIVAIQGAMRHGAKVQGYLHWSLLDNFEWAYGKWPRFGLLAVDYTTYRRTPRASAIWFARVIKQIRKAG